MLTGEPRNQIDKIWNDFWAGGIANPLQVIEQITYLIFIKRLGVAIDTLRDYVLKQRASLDELWRIRDNRSRPERLASVSQGHRMTRKSRPRQPGVPLGEGSPMTHMYGCFWHPARRRAKRVGYSRTTHLNRQLVVVIGRTLPMFLHARARRKSLGSFRR
jgi:HsdM N-terminal domain